MTTEETPTCKHPPTRLYTWFAYDGVLCIGCCDCGAVLAGAANLDWEAVWKNS